MFQILRTRNENLVSFKRGQFEIDESGNLYRVYTYNIEEETDNENLGVSAQFIATEADSTNWSEVNNYVAQVSGAKYWYFYLQVHLNMKG